MDYNDHYFQEISVSNSEFTSLPTVDWKFKSVGIVIVNIGTGSIEYSFNGCRLDGKLDCLVRSISLDNKSVSRIWFRVTAGDNSIIRINAWPKVVA